MISCEELVELMLDYSLGELPADLAAEVERHRGLCHPCVRFQNTYEATRALVRRQLDVPLSAPDLEAIEAEVMRAVREGA